MMPGQLGSEALAQAIQRDTPSVDLIRILGASPDGGKKLLDKLSRHRDPVVRSWVPEVARTLLGISAVPLLMRIASEDRDIDVRDVAIGQLLEADIGAARSLIPLYRRNLQSSDRFGPVAAMWALAAVGDRDAVDLIHAKIAGRQPDALDRMNGEVVILLLTNPSEILRRLKEHDHERMLLLAKAAGLMGTEEATAALRSCLDGSFDTRCQDYCREELARLEARRL